MTKSVKIDDDDYHYITKQAKYDESFAKALKRLLRK
jgi:predicted CopG family antitoxin